MSIYIEPNTKLRLGDSSISPLPQQEKLLPGQEDLNREISRMILSASGWRKIFAISGKEEDDTPDIGMTNTVLAALIAETFAGYIKEKVPQQPVVAVGIDARPTGTAIADTMIRVLGATGITVRYLFITAAPEIMAYARALDGFVYISASHNPIGHNGVKFGLNDGGVLPGSEAAILAERFRFSCSAADAPVHAADLVRACPSSLVGSIFTAVPRWKQEALSAYETFTRTVVSGESDPSKQIGLFDTIRNSAGHRSLGVICDMNGSARTLSVDHSFFSSCGLHFSAINDTPRQIVHAIIPEPENLVHCAREMERLRNEEQRNDIVLGYMPDCDGDRGNIVYWNDRTDTADVLKAQEVFALSVTAELAYLVYCGKTAQNGRIAVAVNDPTSMRIEAITRRFGAETVRAEVGEANVVNLAREMREKGYEVRILGEGSNGGNITHPAAVRDPLNTVFALIKFLILRDTPATDGNPAKKGLFHIWCELSGQTVSYRNEFTLADIIATLPAYTTTGVSEPRALLHIRTTDHAVLKRAFQDVYIHEWEEKKAELAARFGIVSWEAAAYNRTQEMKKIHDFGVSGTGGLKILFKNRQEEVCAFIWMRGSGTEPVFRVMSDVQGNNPVMESWLLDWETKMLTAADALATEPARK
jgi:phosphoglucomutase